MNDADPTVQPPPQAEGDAQPTPAEGMYAALADAAAMLHNYDFVDAFTILKGVEQHAFGVGDAGVLTQCSELQAGIHLYLGDHGDALRYLKRCNFSFSTALLAARVALHASLHQSVPELSSAVADLLAACVPPSGSDERHPADVIDMILENLSISGRLCGLQEWAASVTDEREGIRILRVTRAVNASLKLICLLHGEWLLDYNTSTHYTAPCISIPRPCSRDAESSPDVRTLHSICKSAFRGISRQYDYVFYTDSLWQSLLDLLQLLIHVEECAPNNGECIIRVGVVNGNPPSDSDPSHVTPAAATDCLRRRCKCTSKCLYSRPKAARSNLRTRARAFMNKMPLSLERRGGLRWQFGPSCAMDRRVTRVLERVLRAETAWPVQELAMVFFDVLSRYHHLLDRNRERTAVYTCFLFCFICESLKTDDQLRSALNGLFYSAPSTVDIRLLYGTDRLRSRLRGILRRSGVRVLCLCLDAMRCNPAALRALCAPLSVDDPQEFLSATFGQLSSLLLFLCMAQPGAHLAAVVMRARVLYVMAQRLIIEHFPRRDSVVGLQGRGAFEAVAAISGCLRSLYLAANSFVLHALGQNPHMTIALRHRHSRLNFHNSLTLGSFDLGVSAVERRMLRIECILSRYRMEEPPADSAEPGKPQKVRRRHA
ncbi:DUF2125 domain-containing protein [Babesia caballi]|uniref:DUF2125 domain-containing protein n=1 Tax=Babesia caballi TaxID=5871 RepID=A0AAV4LYD2_BABCB|nr:DUF2125 domain-containing protein [Babesia caballi]